MLIVEDYLFVTARPSGWDHVGYRDVAVAGALLAELAIMERITVADDRLQILDGSSTGDDLLDEALARFGQVEGRKPKNVLTKVGKGLPRLVLERLVVAERMQERPLESFGVVLRTAWVPVDLDALAALRRDLLVMLTGGREVDPHHAAVIALLRATNGLDDALPRDVREGVSFGTLKKRAKELSKGRWATEAVRRAVEAAAAASAATVAAGA